VTSPCVAVIGAGPAGLIAAQALAEAGVEVAVFDAMPSVGRKFLLAGKGGLNLTHAEAFEAFAGRYRFGLAAPRAEAAEPDGQASALPGLDRFGPQAVRDWAAGLGVSTFVGSSGRVFPHEMKAAPLLRAWLQRLRRLGVTFHMRHRWQAFSPDGALRMASPAGERLIRPRAVVLALGGASWSRLGSDGAWVPWLRRLGLGVADLEPSNCGFDVGWSEHFRTRFAGAPLKSVAIAWRAAQGGAAPLRQLGECVVTDTGVEGSLIYAASADLRDTLRRDGQAVFHLDLLPARDADWVLKELTRGRGTRSLSTHLKSRLGLEGVKAGLLHERLTREQMLDVPTLAAAIKALPIVVTATRPIDEAISSAGGVRLAELDEHLMLRRVPGVFCAGEMLDWEAPTGGYLLTGCLCTGRLAGMGAARWLGANAPGTA
jgi:hypothetical protein